MLIGTAAYDITGTLAVGILVADIPSASVPTRNENSNDTSPNRKLHHPCVLVHKMQILTAVQQYQTYAMLVRDRTWCILVRTCCIPCRLPTAECDVFFV